MKTRVFVFDVDGTLMADGKSISDDISSLLNQLAEHGYNFTVATGRTPIECFSLLEKIKPTWPIICLDGRVIYDYKNRACIYKDSPDPTIFSRVKMKYSHMFYLYEEDEFSISSESKITDLYLATSFKVDRKFLTRGPCVNKPFRMFMRYRHQESLSSGQIEEIKKTMSDFDCETYFAGDKWIVLYTRKSDKLNAVRYLCSKYNSTIEEVVAFGDGRNDIELLRNAGISVVMKNAHEDIKQYADVLADDVENIGIKEVLQRFLNENI